MAPTPDTLLPEEDYSNISTLQSILAGIGSGLIAIPKGAFSLGAALYDLGAGTQKSAEVEQWFNDLTKLDEMAEATTAGKISETLINLGVPGVAGFRIGSNLAKGAIEARKSGNYFKLNNPTLAKNAKDAFQLNTRGKVAKFVAGAAGAGLSDAVFVGDVEGIGTFGDLLGGPTEINRDEEDDSVRELINRVKFGTESALFAGIISGTGSTIKKLAQRGKELRFSNDKIDRLLDKVASGFRPRGGTTQEFFDIERVQVGQRAADLNLAQEVSRTLERDIDRIFPPIKTVFNKQKANERETTLNLINDLLLSGDPIINQEGKVVFGPLNEQLKNTVRKSLKKAGANDEAIENIFNGLGVIRLGWGDMFSPLGARLEKKDLQDFKNIFGSKFKSYLGSTYDIFQNKSIIPFFNFNKVSEEAVNKTKEMFKETALQNGRVLTDEQAEYYVNRLVKTAALPKGFRMDKPSDPIFQIPDFFVGKTVLDDAVTDRGFTSLSSLPKEQREIIEELLGKSKNPMQTILGGTARLSLITRRNQFFQDLVNKSDELKGSGNRGMFYNTEQEALANLGPDIKKINIDPGKTLEAGITNPVNGKYAITEIADALEETSKNLRSDTIIGNLYENLVLYPKATSQLAKTVLSPVTHVRNFISAGAFATANGIIPTPTAMREAYSALQAALPGARISNDFYRELLELGIVNSNVRLGDLTNLLKDVGFGETINSDKFLRLLIRPFSKVKKFSEDLYTAEDDFWKITSFAMERQRLSKAYEKFGVTRSLKEIKEEAASIVRNNIPNYDYVGQFVQSLRKLPLGNFMAFPAEIMRTSANIVSRALDEINLVVKNDKGELVKPLRGIGIQRLIGMGATTVAVPAGVVEAAKFVYDVADEEIDAMRRYVADWSKNSTLIPIRDKETEELKYIDFSHTNAYDLLYRPFLTVLNAIGQGRTDKDGMMNDFLRGIATSTKELAEPFISESIWTEAVTDLMIRGGRTREGVQVFNPEDTAGNKITAAVKHLLESQAPFSLSQMRRLDLAIEPVDILQKGKFDKYGQAFELGDELAGITGFRPVKLNVERGLNFKVADLQKGIRESRQLFTRETLRGGEITPEEIVDAYLNANRALFNNKREFFKDINAAKTLGVSKTTLNDAAERLSKAEFGSIERGRFNPLNISDDVEEKFADNARKLGLPNPYLQVRSTLQSIKRQFSRTSLNEVGLPEIENPFRNLPEPTLEPIQGLPQLPNPANIQNYGQLPNAITKLTPVETALLTPGEQLIRQRQRQGTV